MSRVSKSFEVKESIFYRRCHVCDGVSQGQEPVLKCQHCSKAMAPFFYFDVKQSRIYSDFLIAKEAKPSAIKIEMSVKKLEKYSPIEGLTVYW